MGFLVLVLKAIAYRILGVITEGVSCFAGIAQMDYANMAFSVKKLEQMMSLHLEGDQQHPLSDESKSDMRNGMPFCSVMIDSYSLITLPLVFASIFGTTRRGD